VTFAVGLSTSLNRVVGGLCALRSPAVQLYPNLAERPSRSQGPGAAAHSAGGVAGAQPGTLHYVTETGQAAISVAGLTGAAPADRVRRARAAWNRLPA